MFRLLKNIYKSRELIKLIGIRNYFLLPAKRYVQGTVNSVIGKVSYNDAPSFAAGLQEMFANEIYKVRKWSSKRPTVIDCGANIGLSALYFANTYGAYVYAIEADPNIFTTLSRNITLRTAGEIEAVNKAVWINNEGVAFDIEGGYSGQIHQHGSELVKGSIQIPSIRLRDLINQFEKIDFLKLDIEGAENSVIVDCEKVLHKIDYIFIEYHSNNHDAQLLGDLLNILKKEGFRYHIKEAFTSPHPFDVIDVVGGMDLQLNIYATNNKLNL